MPEDTRNGMAPGEVTGGAGAPGQPWPYAQPQQPYPQPQQPYPQPQQPVRAVPRVQQQPEWGYGSTAATQRTQGVPGQQVLPGWAIDQVVDNSPVYIALSVLALVVMPMGSFLGWLFVWMPIVALVKSMGYRTAFKMGNGMLAEERHRSAKAWLIASGVTVALLTALSAWFWGLFY